ncbi:MAG: pantetheine-phosphate adenylyltransferase [Erysipelotrichales bacterium]|nr:pantetheine-phosphate adenylyltransferase [Erysipelotrichales bacterium]
MLKGMYSGSFDPVTIGHLDIIERGALIFEKFYIAVANTPKKNYLFSKEERKEMIRAVTKHLKNVEVVVCEQLLVDFAKKHDIKYILRGLRAVTDFEYELQMADTNKVLNPEIETIFLMADTKYSYLSSSIVKEVASYNGDIQSFVSPLVEEKIKNRFK